MQIGKEAFSNVSKEKREKVIKQGREEERKVGWVRGSITRHELVYITSGYVLRTVVHTTV